jgi:hypothetical protein
MGGKLIYIRKGWTPKEIKQAIEVGKVKVRTKDVGRLGHHYIKMFYKDSGRRGTLVATTLHSRKR